MTDIVDRLREPPEGPGALYLMIEAAAEIERLRAFAKEVIRLSWEGAIDGGDVQEIAEKHGLIVGEVYDPAKHGENCDAVPGEDTIYVFTERMKP